MADFRFESVLDFVALGFPERPCPGDLPVLDFSKGKLSDEAVTAYRVAIGRYDELRPESYDLPLFTSDADGPRNIHMGIDLFAPLGTAVRAVADGRIHLAGDNSRPGDYGATLLTEHQIDGRTLYALYGHLSRKSLEGKGPGLAIRAGQTLGWLGDRDENGGWVPHLHFQLSTERPSKPDLPGTVNQAQHRLALVKYPDPRLVLGPLY